MRNTGSEAGTGSGPVDLQQAIAAPVAPMAQLLSYLPIPSAAPPIQPVAGVEAAGPAKWQQQQMQQQMEQQHKWQQAQQQFQQFQQQVQQQLQPGRGQMPSMLELLGDGRRLRKAYFCEARS